MKGEDGRMIKDDKGKAEAWASRNARISTSNKENPEADEVNITQMVDYIPLTMEEFDASLREQNNGRATGPDEVPIEFIRALGPKARKKLLDIVNESVSRGVLPDDWLDGIWVPVWKPSKPEDEISSYRPVTLTSHIAKLVERMIARRLVFTICGTFNRTQYGFRKGRSTADALLDLILKVTDHFNTEWSRTPPGRRSPTRLQRELSRF
jgi:hypothetical protein